jgi:hypothetical protein
MAQPVKSNDWFPSRLADQAEMFANVKAKIGGYTAMLPITAAQQTEITLICNEFASVYNYVAQARATTESIVEWRGVIFNGEPAGSPAPPVPVFTAYAPVIGAVMGIFTRFRDLVDIIKAAPAYTRAIGEDLMIVAVKGETLEEADVIPSLKVKVAGHTVDVSGSLQGLDAMRVEYTKDGTGKWTTVAFLTKMPGQFTIALTTPGTPESGRIRAVFIEKNEEFGSFSPEYPVTLS